MGLSISVWADSRCHRRKACPAGRAWHLHVTPPCQGLLWTHEEATRPVRGKIRADSRSQRHGCTDEGVVSLPRRTESTGLDPPTFTPLTPFLLLGGRPP